MKTIEHKNGPTIKEYITNYVAGLRQVIVLLDGILADFDEL